MFTVRPLFGIPINLGLLRVELRQRFQVFDKYFRALFSIFKLIETDRVVLNKPRLAFSGTTASYPALVQVGTGLELHTADNSSHANFVCKHLLLYDKLPSFYLSYNIGGTDNKLWWTVVAGTTLAHRTISDDLKSFTTYHEVVRSGITIIRNRVWKFSQVLPTVPDDGNLAPSNLDMYFYLQSNTSLRVRVRGSDGVVREGTIVLS